MNQSAKPTTKPLQPRVKSDVSLPDLPRQPLSPKQQAEAVERASAAAQQRVELGAKLLDAARSQVVSFQSQAQSFRDEQQAFRESVERDVAGSFRQYDGWIERMESRLTTRIERMEGKLDAMEAEWQRVQSKLESFVQRAVTLIEHSQTLVDMVGSGVSGSVALQTPVAPTCSEGDVGDSATTPVAQSPDATLSEPIAEQDGQANPTSADDSQLLDESSSGEPTIRYAELIDRLRQRVVRLSEVDDEAVGS